MNKIIISDPMDEVYHIYKDEDNEKSTKMVHNKPVFKPTGSRHNSTIVKTFPASRERNKLSDVLQ